MGAGSFGGLGAGNAMTTINLARGLGRNIGGGFGGGQNSNNEPKKGFSWIWASINLFLFFCSLTCLICMTCLPSKYIRVGKLYLKDQSTYQHKGNYYPEYFFTVKWNDRGKEIETFQVSGETFFACKKGENVYFKKTKPEYEWTTGVLVVLGCFLFAIAWVISGIAALLKNE